ncbi:MAG TPA: hypothetical protein VIJ14_08020 [Rhabdochlamydiaceae bacterium]
MESKRLLLSDEEKRILNGLSPKLREKFSRYAEDNKEKLPDLHLMAQQMREASQMIDDMVYDLSNPPIAVIEVESKDISIQ